MAKQKLTHEWNDLDDYVWFMDKNVATREKIVGMWRTKDTIFYLFFNGVGSINEHKFVQWTLCFNTKEALLASL